MTGTSLIATMAERYHMDPVQFAKTVRRTAMPSDHTDEQFAAFCMVAHEYGLNPVTREIYAYANKKTGGVQPVVSIDGWVHLVNEHPKFDGMQITLEEQPGPPPPPGKPKPPPVSATCTMWRKDRRHPIVVTEHYSECVRNTEPWNQMPRRMLRHKALKEAARYAFGFAGITDEDEGHDVAGTVKQIQKHIVVEADALDDWAAGKAENIPQSDGSFPGTPSSDEEPSDLPGAGTQPDSAGEDLRQDAINEMLILATDTSMDRQQSLEALEARLPVWEDRIGEPLAREIAKTCAKVARGEQKPEKARNYLENLP